MDFRKKFSVPPGAKFKLADIDPGYKGKHESHESAPPKIARHVESLAQLQYKLYAEGNVRSSLSYKVSMHQGKTASSVTYSAAPTHKGSTYLLPAAHRGGTDPRFPLACPHSHSRDR